MGRLAIQAQARVRDLYTACFGLKKRANVHVNPRGEMLLSRGLPEQAEILSLGRSAVWVRTAERNIQSQAPDVVGADATVLNLDPVMWCVIESFGCLSRASAPPAYPQFSLWGCVSEKRCPAMYAGLTQEGSISTPTGSKYTGKAIVVRELTNAQWTPGRALPHGTSGETVTNPGAPGQYQVQEASVSGLFLVPPNGGMFSVFGVNGGSGSATYFIRWHEAELQVR